MTVPELSARAGKGTRDYLRALLRRSWLVLLVTATIGGAGTALSLWQKPVYWASSRVLIEPPRAIVSGLNEENGNRAQAENFFNTRVQMIASRQITERVMHALELSNWDELNGFPDPVAELQGWITVKPVQNSNLVDVGLLARDPKLAAKIVNTTVEEFLRYEQDSMQEFDQMSRGRIETELRGLEGLVNSARQALADFHKEHKNFLITGESLEAGRLAILEEAKAQSELRLDAAKRSVEQFQAMREAGIPFRTMTSQQRIAAVKEELRQFDEELEYQRSVIRPELYDADVAIRRLREKREELAKSLTDLGNEEAELERERLRQEEQFAEVDYKHLTELTEQQRKAVVGQQDEQNKLGSLQAEHLRVRSLGDFIARKKLEVELHQGLVTPRIQVVDRAQTPRAPVRPILPVQIPLCFALGLLCGVGLVVALEAADHTVRSPEDLRGLVPWPLLAVIPRFRKRELGGKSAIAALDGGARPQEAFRALRAAVLGAELDRQPLRRLLISGAEPGVGKSLVALNLATTCARAGESVLLIDANLRDSAISRDLGVAATAVGLIDVLEGDMPWKQSLQTTPVENLSLLPAGDAGAVPLDVLGTVEMFDLLTEAAEHFDRVIIDAPALVGLADARVVGRFADGVLFVVSAGMRDRRPLARACQLCEQEGLRPVGVVFNGLAGRHEDLAALAALPASTKRAQAGRRIRSARTPATRQAA